MPHSNIEREKQEIQFITGPYKDTPHNFEMLSNAHKEGIITKSSRNPEVRHLVEVIESYGSRPVVYDYNSKGWKTMSGNERYSGQTTSMQNYKNLWNHHIKNGMDSKILPEISGCTKDKNVYAITEGSNGGEDRLVSKVQINCLYGLELEMFNRKDVNNTERCSDVYVELKEWGKDNIILHSDGSIRPSSEGKGQAYISSTEMVTIPKPLRELKMFIKEFCASGMASKFSSNDSCGLHIHVSKEPFNCQTDAPRLLYFINAFENQTFMKAIGRREANQYCKYKGDTVQRFKGKKLYDMLFDSNAVRDLQDHYAALSISTRHPTFECRIFKGSTQLLELLASVEFLDAVCMFVRNTNSNLLSYKDFLVWLTDNRNTRYLEKDRKSYKLNYSSEYRDLVEYIKQKELIIVNKDNSVTIKNL